MAVSPKPARFIAGGRRFTDRYAVEWMLLRPQLFKILLIMIFKAVIDPLLIRGLSFLRHRQLVDQIPQAWCTKIWGNATHCAEHAHELANGGRLPDLGFDLIPDLTDSEPAKKSAELIEIIIWVMYIGSFLLWQYSWFFPQRSDMKAAPRQFFGHIMMRTGHVIVVVTALRPLLFLATTLPGPAPKCIGMTEQAVRPKSLSEAWSDFGPLMANACGDLIYSGHMMHSVVAISAFFRYSDILLRPYFSVARAMRFAMIILCIAQSYLIIALRNHYTVDVILGVIIPRMCWQLWCENFEDPEVSLTLQQLRYPPITGDDKEEYYPSLVSIDDYVAPTDADAWKALGVLLVVPGFCLGMAFYVTWLFVLA